MSISDETTSVSPIRPRLARRRASCAFTTRPTLHDTSTPETTGAPQTSGTPKTTGASNSVTIAHLSDCHLPNVRGFWPRYWNVKRTLGWLNWKIKRRVIHRHSAIEAMLADIAALAPDHIAITGDLVNIGLPTEYEAARDWLTVVGPPDRVSVVPGNHDIYVDPEGANGTALWRAYMSSDAFGATVGGATAAEPPTGGPWYRDAFPYVRRIGPVALIGINSSHPTAIGYASGAVGPAQRERLGRILEATGEAGLARVVMIHHPPVPWLASPRRALSDVGDVEALIARHGAELVLHGHNHVVSDEEISGEEISTEGDQSVRVLGIGSASAEYPYKHEPRACWRLIRIARDPASGGFSITCELRGYQNYGDVVQTIGTTEFLSSTVTPKTTG